MSLFAKLMGSAAAAPAQASDPAPAPAPAAPAAPAPAAAPAAAAATSALTEAQIEAGLQAAKAEGHAEGLAAGAQAERDRTAAVFASEEGKANMGMAAWMLAASPTASAEQIVAQLKTCPAPAAASAAVPAPSHQQQAQQQLATVPKVDLNGGKPAANSNDGGAQVEDIWADIHKGRDPKAIRTGN